MKRTPHEDDDPPGIHCRVHPGAETKPGRVIGDARPEYDAEKERRVQLYEQRYAAGVPILMRSRTKGLQNE